MRSPLPDLDPGVAPPKGVAIFGGVFRGIGVCKYKKYIKRYLILGNIKRYTLDTINLIFFLVMLAAAKYIGAGLACSGLIGAGAGIGLIFSSLIASTARNPQIKGQLFSYAILGFALAEATGLFSLMIGFLLLYS